MISDQQRPSTARGFRTDSSQETQSSSVFKDDIKGSC
jgi:hypothetical protein